MTDETAGKALPTNAYTGPVGFFNDHENGESYYVAVPEVEWEDKGAASDPHPHGQLTEEELRALPRVLWVPAPDLADTAEIPEQHIRADYSQEPINQNQLRAGADVGKDPRHMYYTIPASTVNVGGGYFVLADDHESAATEPTTEQPAEPVAAKDPDVAN
jgi:hypothetical protein